MEKKLKVKESTFKTHLSFNEWVKELNVSRDYVTPTPYFKENSKNGYQMLMQDEKPEPVMWNLRKLAVKVIDGLAITNLF